MNSIKIYVGHTRNCFQEGNLDLELQEKKWGTGGQYELGPSRNEQTNIKKI